MVEKIRRLFAREIARATEETAGWFDELDPAQKKAYIKKHPTSKYAKAAKTKVVAKKARVASSGGNDVAKLADRVAKMESSTSSFNFGVIKDSIKDMHKAGKKVDADSVIKHVTSKNPHVGKLLNGGSKATHSQLNLALKAHEHRDAIQAHKTAGYNDEIDKKIARQQKIVAKYLEQGDKGIPFSEKDYNAEANANAKLNELLAQKRRINKK